MSDNELLNEETPDLAMYQPSNATSSAVPAKTHKKATRLTMPSTRILGALHPTEFAKDLAEMLYEINRQGDTKLTQGELIEIAFYALRQKVKGKDAKAPNWVPKLKL